MRTQAAFITNEAAALRAVVELAEEHGRYELSMSLRMFAVELGLAEAGYDKDIEEDAAYDG